MKLSPRELLLAWLTAVVVVLLATWQFYAAPRFEELRDLRERAERAGKTLHREALALQLQDEIRARFQAAYRELASFPETLDVTADMLIKVEGLATAHNLVLTRREPQKERRQGDIATLDIKCNWEGSLEALVRFLYALRQDHAMLDISELYIRAEGKGVLKGNFTINCSFVRRRPGEPEPAPVTLPPTAPPEKDSV